MRDIKFRGLDINGDWHYGLLCKPLYGKYKGKIFISNRVGSPMAYEVRPETVGQITGLKDKEGKEIYDGDIIDYNTRKLEVYYNSEKGGYYLRGKSFDFPTSQMIGMFDYYIIGNIYEPNLLPILPKE